MNPLLHRLFENRSKSKSKGVSLQKQQHNRSVDRVLVPKVPTKTAKLQALPEPINKRKNTVQRVYVGKLPSISLKTQQNKQYHITRPNFRNRKLSTSIRDLEGNFMSNQYGQNTMLTQFQVQQMPVRFKQITKPSKNQEKTFRVQSQAYEQQDENQQEELFQYLTVLQNNQELNQQFCYMNRKDLPYSFYIVKYQNRNKNQYLTVSLRGITYEKQGQSQFFTIKKFTKQIQQFKSLKKINFFRNYALMKAMTHWKDKMIRKKFNLKCKFLLNHLFSQNMMMQNYLHFLHDLGYQYSGGKFFDTNIIITKNLDQYLKSSELDAKKMLKQIRNFDNIVEKQLKALIQKMIHKFRADERVTLGTGDKKLQQEPYLPFDAKRRSMKYTQMAKLKQFQWMVYRLIKYTDMYRFNVKVDLIRKSYENSIQQVQNLKKAFENKETVRFTNWIYADVFLQEKQDGFSIVVQPSLQELTTSIMGIKDFILKQIFKDHRLYIQKKDTMHCQSLELDEDEHTSKFQLKYHVLKSPQFQALQTNLIVAFKDITDAISDLLSTYNRVLLQIYKKNSVTNNIQAYLDNQSIYNYLSKYREEYNRVVDCQDNAQFALVVLRIQSLKEKIRKSTQDKYKIIASSVPTEIIKRCEGLQILIRNLHTQIKENPYSVEDYIQFMHRYNEQKHKVGEIEAKMEKILQFEEIVYKYGIRIGETAKSSISQCQMLHKQLLKRLEQIESNEQAERKKFETIVDEMIPLIEQKSQQLLKEIHIDNEVNTLTSDIKRVNQKLQQFSQSFIKIKKKQQQLFINQVQLKLGHKQLEIFTKLETSLQFLQQIWKTRQYYFYVQSFIRTTGFGHINELSIEPLLTFTTNSDTFFTVLQCYELLQQFKVQTSNLLKIIKISQLLSADTLQQDHLQDLKKIIKSNNHQIIVQLLFTKQSKSKITCLQIYTDTNASQIEHQISEIVFLSAQQNIVKSQLLEVQQYWKKAKMRLISQDIAQNEFPILHLDQNEEMLQKLGFYLIMLKNIEGSSHIIGIARDRASINSKICNYLIDFISKWRQVQKQWIKLLPLMTNCPAVKHQSNVFFQFASVDSTIKKLIRYINDMSSIKKVCDDYLEKRYMNMLLDSQSHLITINVTFNQFLQSKRSTYGRFYFLSDYQLINILEHVKDARSASKHVSLCFNCDSLELDNQLMAGFKHKEEFFKLRKTILKGQSEEIFKNIEENMKNSLKLNVKSLIPKLKVTPNLESQLQQFAIQIILVADRIFWTQMSQNYLNTINYEQYKLLFNNTTQKMKDLLLKIDKKFWRKQALRYVQMISLRDISLQLVRDQITLSDFKWKQQLKIYASEQEIYVNQFDGKLVYGCEYYPPGNIHIPTMNSLRFLYQTYYACVNNRSFVISGGEGQGKKNLVWQTGSYFGSYQKQIVCNSRLSQQFILRLVQGTLLSGAWLSFYDFNSLNYTVCSQLLFAINKATSVDYRSHQYLFMILPQKKDYQQISIYNFNHFAVYQPDKHKICEYLMQIYGFFEYYELTKKIMAFLKLVKPFLARIMGSQLQLIKKIVTKSGEKNIVLEEKVNEGELVAKVIAQQIISKQIQSKYDILWKALSTTFGIQYKKTQAKDNYNEKLLTLTEMIQKNAKNIIVLGQRSSKTSIIKNCLQNLNKDSVCLYAQSTDNFFSQAAMQYLGSIPINKIVIYDSNNPINEWVDLVTSDYLFIEGKRLIIYNQIIMEFRDISKCSPSFVGKCQILYIGQTVVSNWEKFNRIYGKQNNNYRQISDILQDLFGKSLQNLPDIALNIIANLLKSYKQAIPVKNLQRIIIWLVSVIDKPSYWVRNFGGKHTDFTFSGSQLISVDIGRIQNSPHSHFESYLITPTKSSVILIDTIHLLDQLKIPSHIEGPQQSGKTSFLNLLNRKYQLSIKKSSHQWSDQIKERYTQVRRDGRNMLIDFQKQGHRIVIDDLDLGIDENHEYLRVLIQTSTFRDRFFNQYTLQKFKMLTCSRKHQKIGKFLDRVCILNLQDQSKESVQTIYTININRMITQLNMNRQVQQLIQGNILKSILIAHDDLSNAIGTNPTSSLLLGLLKNLLSLPKRQAFISGSNYYLLFRTLFVSKIMQKNHHQRMEWHLKSIYENIFKVVFGEKERNEDIRMVYSQGIYKQVQMTSFKQKIKNMFPDIICFDKLIQNVFYLINQFHSIDDRVLIVGKKGTGKRMILEIFSKISGIPIFYDFSQAIINCFKSDKIVLIENLSKETTFYEALDNCSSDKDLEKLISNDHKQNFRARSAGQDLNDIKLLQRCKKMLMFAFIGEQNDYDKLKQRKREVLNIPICYVQQWPAEALLNYHSSTDSHAKMHAEIFLMVNKILTNQNLGTYTLKIFEKYLKLYTEIYTSLEKETKLKIQQYTRIHFKFNQSHAMISAWQARVQILRVEIEQSIKNSSQVILVNELYSFALSIFYKQIKGEEEKYAAQTEELKRIDYDLQKKIILMEKVLKKIEKIVSSFQRTELGQLKKIYKQNKAVYFGVECLCILLGEQQSDQKAINKILADPNLLMRMKAPQILTNRNSKLESIFSKQYQAIESEMKNNTNELAKTLIQWLHNILQYWQTFSQHQVEQQKQKDIKNSLQKSSQRHKQLDEQVKRTKRLIDEKMLIIEEKQKFKAQKQVEYNSINSRLEHARKILPILQNELIQTKKTLQTLTVFLENLKGNAIMSAFTSIYLPRQPLIAKQRLLQMVKSKLKSNMIIWSKKFMAQISGEELDSLQSLNYYLLKCTSLPKLVIDPHRKFFNYLETNAPLQMIEEVIEHAEEKKEFEEGKIYHTTFDFKNNSEDMLLIDWQSFALQERQAIFLQMAEFKKPQYFQIKAQLQFQINRNLQKLKKMKQNLYKTICERELKIIDDQSFIQSGQQLRKLQDETYKLRTLAQQKMKQIQQLTFIINEQVSKIIFIFEILKKFRKVDLLLMLDVCKHEGNTIQNFIRWSLANIKQKDRSSFLMSVMVSTNMENNRQLLEDLINEVPLKIVQTKIKKPQMVSLKYWEVVVKLSYYSNNFKKLMEAITKSQLQFQKWCNDPLQYILPIQLGVNLQYIETWAILTHIKPKIAYYSIKKIIKQQYKFNVSPFNGKEIINNTDSKFPIFLQNKLQNVLKIVKDLNQSKFSLIRVSKIKDQIHMKNLIWKSMQAKQWFICYDIQTPKHFQILQNICYYVMNYDKQPNFRVIIVSDGQQGSQTRFERGMKSSAFLYSQSIFIYQQINTCDQLLAQNQIEYQLSFGGKNQTSTNKHIFNKTYKLAAVCYYILRKKYPALRVMPFKRIVETLQFIKFKNLSVQFNVLTIVQYIARIMSHNVGVIQQRREIQELWEHIVDQSKMSNFLIYGIPIDEEKYDNFLEQNHQIMGHSQTYFIRKAIQEQSVIKEALSRLLGLQISKEQLLAFIRTQLGKIPVQISHKTISNTFSYFYETEILLHNQRVNKLKNFLSLLNNSAIFSNSNSQREKKKNQSQIIYQLINQLEKTLQKSIYLHSIKTQLTKTINLLRKQHDFLLYFNPTLPIILIDPNLVSNLSMLINSYAINTYYGNRVGDAHKWSINFDFTQFHHERDMVNCQGLFLSNLRSQQFIFNSQMKTVDPSFEIDGIQICPIISIILKRINEDSKQEEFEIAETYIQTQKGTTEVLIQCSAVFRQWGLRSPKILLV